MKSVGVVCFILRRSRLSTSLAVKIAPLLWSGKGAMRTAARTIEADNCITPHYFSTSCQHIKHSDTCNTHTETNRHPSGLKRPRQRIRYCQRVTTYLQSRGAALQFSATLKITCYASYAHLSLWLETTPLGQIQPMLAVFCCCFVLCQTNKMTPKL